MGRKKPITIDDVEYSFADEVDQKAEVEEKETVTLKKKNKKGGAKGRKGEDAEPDEAVTVAAADPGDGEDQINHVFSGKKKSTKSKKNSGVVSVFSALALEEEDADANDDISEVTDNNHVEDELDFDFGKKKKSKKKKKGNKNALDEEDNEDKVESSHVEDEEEDESKDAEFDFGKKKPTKKKGGGTAEEEKDLDADLDDGPLPPEAVVTEPKEAEVDSKKQKRKKKKSGRTQQEEDDLDKLLLELDGAPTSSAAPPPVAEQSVQAAVEPVEAEDKEGDAVDTVESAAAKKKRKKKEKEKEKKAAEKEKEVKVEAPVKVNAVDNKKLPKRVREIQEALARRKEEEEKRKREEEEKLRKEEEERKKLEELEKQAEEDKRRKKEREKEKLLKKRQEGKPLTNKQKEDQRRLEAMRRQILELNGLPIWDDPAEVKKRPKYETKKSKPKAIETEKLEENKQEVVEPEIDQVEEDDITKESQSQAGEVEDNKHGLEEAEALEGDEDEDEEEWDAKSFDDVHVILRATSPFAEEDKEEEDGQLAVKNSASAPVDVTKKTADLHVDVKKGDVENNARHEEAKRGKTGATKKEVKPSEDASRKSSGNQWRNQDSRLAGAPKQSHNNKNYPFLFFLEIFQLVA